MIPVRDVIPSRTRPGVTVALLAAQAAGLLAPGVRQWWLPWCVNIVVLWLFGSTLEDRLGHGRFALFCLLCATTAAAASVVAGSAAVVPVAAGGAVAGVSAAYLLMFPRSRILALVPVAVGLDVMDVPAWFVLGVWVIVQGAAAGTVGARDAAASGVAMIIGMFTGAVTGGLACLLLRRPERMGVDWWD